MKKTQEKDGNKSFQSLVKSKDVVKILVVDVIVNNRKKFTKKV